MSLFAYAFSAAIIFIVLSISGNIYLNVKHGGFNDLDEGKKWFYWIILILVPLCWPVALPIWLIIWLIILVNRFTNKISMRIIKRIQDRKAAKDFDGV